MGALTYDHVFAEDDFISTFDPEKFCILKPDHAISKVLLQMQTEAKDIVDESKSKLSNLLIVNPETHSAMEKLQAPTTGVD